MFTVEDISVVPVRGLLSADVLPDQPGETLLTDSLRHDVPNPLVPRL